MAGHSSYLMLGYKLEDAVAFEHARETRRIHSTTAFIRALMDGEIQLTEAEKSAKQQFVGRRYQHIERLQGEYAELFTAVQASLTQAQQQTEAPAPV